MAIDDNTLYGLTGAQVKELPGKIEAVKGLARELTAEDYNFHTSGDTDNRIALWLLPPGIYCWNRSLNGNVLVTRSSNVQFNGNGMVAIVADGYSYKPILLFSESTQGFGLNYWQVGSGGYSGSGTWVSFSLVDNLTTDHGYEALSAKQGKVLKDLIGDLTNLTTTDKTNLVAAINEAAAGGGGGGFTELTTEDYDWPTANPTHVALWNLPDGMYWLGSGVNGVATTSSISDGMYINGGLATAFIWSSNAGYKSYVVFKDNTAMLYKVTSTGAIGSPSYPVSLITNVVQTTGTSTTDVMSQNATTSMVFKDPGTRERVQIGKNSDAAGSYSTAIGHLASATGDYTTCLGYGSGSSHKSGVAFTGGKTTAQGEVQIGLNASAGWSTYGYNNSAYRLLTGLYDPQSDHDAATKGYVDNSLLDKQDALTAGSGISIADESGSLVISATGSGGGVVELTTDDYNYPADNPTSVALWLLDDGIYHVSTSVVVRTATYSSLSSGGDDYIILSKDGTKYIFRTANNTLYKYITSSSGDSIEGNVPISPTVVQEPGGSTKDVMCQAAVTGMVFRDPLIRKQVQIGYYSTAGGNSCVGIGYNATSEGNGAIALGAGSRAMTQGEMNIGSNFTTDYGYNNSNYRLLTGLYDPQNAHDAATKGYVDTAVAGAGASAFTTNEWNALWA